MKYDRLKCPACKQRMAVLRLIQGGWRMKCGSCGSPLHYTPLCSRRVGTIAGISFAFIIMSVGTERIWRWPNYVLFLIFAVVYGQMLYLLLGQLEQGPYKANWKLSLPPVGIPRTLYKVGITGMIATGVCGLFWRHLPFWLAMTLLGGFAVSWLCFVVSLIYLYFGKGGIFRRQPDK